MTTGEKVAILLGVANAVGLPALLIWYVRQRRKDHAEANVAEGTVKAKIDLSNTSAAESHVALLEKAFTAERASFDRRIDVLLAEKQAAVAEAAQYKAELAAAQIKLQELQSQITELSSQLQEALDRIADLLKAHDHS